MLVPSPALAVSMISDARPITLKEVGVAGSLNARQAESVGLIATELVMNALKHAFPDHNKKGRINVAYDVDGTNWKLSVADNGIGKLDGVLKLSRNSRLRIFIRLLIAASDFEETEGPLKFVSGVTRRAVRNS